jgi:hypothetical protein
LLENELQSESVILSAEISSLSSQDFDAVDSNVNASKKSVEAVPEVTSPVPNPEVLISKRKSQDVINALTVAKIGYSHRDVATLTPGSDLGICYISIIRCNC